MTLSSEQREDEPCNIVGHRNRWKLAETVCPVCHRRLGPFSERTQDYIEDPPAQREEPLTGKMVRDAVEKLMTRTYEPCPHVVHPKYGGYRLALDSDPEDAVVYTRCAACFAFLALAR